MTAMFTNLESIAAAYTSAAEAENSALFAQGDVIVQAVADGFNVNEVVNHCAGLTRRTSRTVFRRYKTARVFTPDERNPECNWELHAIAASTDNPHDWLAKAADSQWSSRQLKDAIAVSGDVVEIEPEYVLDRVPCAVFVNADGTYTVAPGEGEYTVTIMQALKAPSVDISQIREGV